ncbi:MULTISPECIES: hypothetical protein [unclassified Streptomyces]|uniref:hypothetical protein n=1 Tax=unclassified Streptomyces TaxID=2593676 RepID=UPI0038068D59
MRRTAAAVTMLVLATAGCTDSGSRAYTVPDTVCGVAVDSDLLSPLLPDGEKLTQRAYDAGQESPRCRLSVDGKLVVYLTGDVVAADTDPLKVQDRALVRLGNPAAVDIGDGARVADNGALAVARCAYEGRQSKFVTLVQLQKKVPAKTSQRRDALRSFLESYFPKAMAKQGCTQAS